MKQIRPPLTFSITNSIKDIPKQAWDGLFGDIIEDYGYHKTLEDAKMKEFSISYLLGKRDEQIVAILPFFIMHFSFETVIGGFLHSIAHSLRHLLRVKAMFIGSPATERYYLAIAKNEDLKEIINNILTYLYKFAKKEKLSGMLFYNISQKDKLLAEYLAKKNFFEMESLPNTIIKINTDSLDSHISSLSRNTRRDLRRKLRRSNQRASLRTEIRDNIEGIENDVYKLYMNNFNDSDVYFEVLTPEFFTNICKNMPGTAKYFITYNKDKIVAFNLCLIKNGLFLDKYIGFDQDLAKTLHLYFTTFCYNLDWSIKNGLRFYQTGVSDYYPKIRLGAKLIPLYIYTKAFNPLLNIFLRIFKKIIEPKNLDSSLKEVRWFIKDGVEI